VHRQPVGLGERALVQQQVDALPGGELASLVLLLDPFLAALFPGVLPVVPELVDLVVHRYVILLSTPLMSDTLWNR